jgi:transcription initiation factor IIF auxiliary subunit
VRALKKPRYFTDDADARTVFKKPPFRIDEKGWGEFDMNIVLTAVGKGGDHTLAHDLNFQSERYEAKHQVVSEACLYGPSIRLMWFP